MCRLSTTGVFAGIARSYIRNFLRADKAMGEEGEAAPGAAAEERDRD